MLLKKWILCAAACVVIAPSSFAFQQEYNDSYPKNLGIDVLEYVFEISVSDDTDIIRGQATVDARYVEGGQSSFRLDLIQAKEELEGKGMSVQSVTMNGESLTFEHTDDQVFVDLGMEVPAGKRIQLTFAYEGNPAAGLKIGPNKYGDRGFYSDNWSSRVRNWLPTVDHPYDKAMTEMIITAPAKYQVASNGNIAEVSDMGEGMRRTHYKNPVPTATWLYFMGVAQMAVQQVDTYGDVPIETWVYWQDRDAGFYDFAVPSKDVLAFYSDLVGPYVNKRLANIVSTGTPGGGMEAASTPAYAPSSVTGTRSRRWQHVIIHEIAHQWFGNAVTQHHWNDVWLSEGFATYYTLLFREHQYGHDNFIDGLKDSRQRIIDFYKENYDFQLVRPFIDDLNNVSGAMMYQKGAWTLHMLREKLGHDVYNTGIKTYYAEYMNKNAQTADLRRHLEEASGMNLEGYFNQWLFQGGIPHLEINWSQKRDGFEIHIEQTQDTYRFDLSVEVELVYEDGSVEMETIQVGEMGHFAGQNDSKLVDVVIDPHTRVLASWNVSNK